MLILLPPSEGKAAPRRGQRLDLTRLSSPQLAPAREQVLAALVDVCRADPVRAAGEFLFEYFADGLRLTAGDVEASAGEVVGLFRGERQREDEDQDPGAQHPAAATSEEP